MPGGNLASARYNLKKGLNMQRKLKKRDAIKSVEFLLNSLSYVALRNVIDAILDMVEDAVHDNEAKINQATIDNISFETRALFDLPDEESSASK